MKSKEDKKRGNMKVFFLIANMIIAVFAFSYLISGQSNYDEEVRRYTADDGDIVIMYYAPTPNDFDGSSYLYKEGSNQEGQIFNSLTDAEDYYSDTIVPAMMGTNIQVNTQQQPIKDKQATPQADQPGENNQPPSVSALPSAIGLLQGGEPGFTSRTVSFGKDFPFELKEGGSVIADGAKQVGQNDWELLNGGESVGTVNTNVLEESNLKPELIQGGTNFNKGFASSVPQTIKGELVNGQLTNDGKLFLSDDGTIYKLGTDGKTWIKSGVSPKTGSSTLSKLLGADGGGMFDAFLTGVQWAVMAYGVGQMIGGLAGMDTSQTAALSNALGAGAFALQFTEVQGWADAGFFAKEGGNNILGFGSAGVGLIVAAIIFAISYKEESKEMVTFTCQPWQPPVGGDDCEKCNEIAGCSEYKCKSLGQACELLNVGTEEEKCAWVNPRDAKSPGISPWEYVLTEGYVYSDVRIRPPGDGSEPGRMTIEKQGGGCVEAFTPLEFGITTTGPDNEDEPAQCKIDYNHTDEFDDMSYWMGESNMFLYNHSQKLSLPSPAAIKAEAPELEHDGTYSLYVRCMDANGNQNVDEFVVRFCVDEGPDTTPPKIEGTSIANGMPVKFNQSNIEIDVYVNEPAECKWSRDDKSYNQMETDMACSNKVWEMNNNLVYTCKTTLTGIKDRQENKFYFRCKDQPNEEETNRNVNAESYEYILIGTEPLNIIDVQPNGTIKGSTDIVSVNIEVETANGYKNGEAICYYSETENEGDYIEFFETGTHEHKQRLDLPEGDYKYYLKCVDLGGNRDDNATEFTVDVDTESPIIVRVYQENLLLKVITLEDSDCKYSIDSCNFKFEDGIDMPYPNQTEHFAEWETENSYYIRCSDEYGNIPVSNTCSLVVRPYDVVEQQDED